MAKIEQSIEVNATPQQCYELWSQFTRFPEWMKPVKEITQQSGERYHWVVDGPLGKTVEWDAEVSTMTPGEVVAWRSVEGSEVTNIGNVSFEDLGNNRCRINANIAFEPPAGAAGEAVAAIFSNPDHMVKEALENFKTVVEQRQTSGVA